MALEIRVREEIDSWEVSVIAPNRNPANYSDLVKPILYGIGIGVTATLCKDLSSSLPDNVPIDLLDYDIDIAVTEFKKSYLLANLERHGYSSTETGLAIGLSEVRKNAGVSLANILNRLFKSTASKMKVNPQLREQARKRLTYARDGVIAERRHALVEEAIEEIEKYIPLINPKTLLKRIIAGNVKKMAERFVALAEEEVTSRDSGNKFFDLPYHEAVNEFKRWYLAEQVKRHGSGVKAARHSGMTESDYSTRLHRFGLSVKEILKGGSEE